MKKTMKINQPHLSIPVTLDEALESITSHDCSPSASHLSKLSDLSKEQLRIFRLSWSKLGDFQRQEVISKLAEIAEHNVEFNFDAIFKAGLEDRDQQVRLNSIAGLWENDEAWLMQKLLNILKSDKSTDVRIAAAQALERFCLIAELEEATLEHKEKLESELLDVFYNKEETTELRRRALEAVAPLSLSNVLRAIKAAYESGEMEFKVSSIYAMGLNCDLSWLPVLFLELENKDPELRYEAARACGELSQDDAIPHLIPVTRDEDKDVAIAAISSLGKIGDDEARETLQSLVNHSDQVIREAAEQALHELELYNDPFSQRGLNLGSIFED